MVVKQVVTTDKNLHDGKATNRKQQSVNGLPTTKNPDRIKQLESCPLKLFKHGNKSILVNILVFAIFVHGGMTITADN